MSNKVVPSRISVTEEYRYQTKISGVRYVRVEQAQGLIEVLVPYDKCKYFNQPNAANDQTWSLSALRNELQLAQIGHLHVNHYGRSNVNNSHLLELDEDNLPIRIELGPHQLEDVDINVARHFDLCLTHLYQPDEPDEVPIKVSVRVKDEDFIDPQEIRRDETVEEKLVREIGKQAGLKHSLTIGFRARLFLPPHLGVHYEHNPPCISQMTLAWPIATPCRVVNLRIGFALYPPIIHDPGSGNIEWVDVPLKFQRKSDEHQFYTYFSDWMFLEISEPIEIYQILELSGKVKIEMNGLFSGLDIDYCHDDEMVPPVPVTFRTVLANEFELNLEEGLELKYYSPRQHLHFPGVVLDEMRVTDIILLLEDRGFALKTSGWKKQQLANKSNLNESTEKRQYVIEAVRIEGARELTIFILIQGTDAGTTREREIPGKTKYTTPLPTGATTIYIRGQLQGDSKRAVNVVNEIQRQLKEQFRHVGAVE